MIKQDLKIGDKQDSEGEGSNSSESFEMIDAKVNESEKLMGKNSDGYIKLLKQFGINTEVFTQTI